MKNDKITKLLLTVIAIALVGNLVRPLFDSKPAQAQSDEATILKSPTIIKAQEGVPYMVLSNGHLSVWYLNVDMSKINVKELTTEQIKAKIMENSKLVRSDYKQLP